MYSNIYDNLPFLYIVYGLNDIDCHHYYYWNLYYSKVTSVWQTFCLITNKSCLNNSNESKIDCRINTSLTKSNFLNNWPPRSTNLLLQQQNAGRLKEKLSQKPNNLLSQRVCGRYFYYGRRSSCDRFYTNWKKFLVCLQFRF